MVYLKHQSINKGKSCFCLKCSIDQTTDNVIFLELNLILFIFDCENDGKNSKIHFSSTIALDSKV